MEQQPDLDIALAEYPQVQLCEMGQRDAGWHQGTPCILDVVPTSLLRYGRRGQGQILHWINFSRLFPPCCFIRKSRLEGLYSALQTTPHKDSSAYPITVV